MASPEASIPGSVAAVRPAARHRPPPPGAVRLLERMTWLLPLALCLIAVVVEVTEHVGEEGEPFTVYFFIETIIFAVVGPVAVWLTLIWVTRLVRAYQATAAELSASNERLETSVVERTRHLETASRQLEAANLGLEEANGQLRQLDRMKSEFVSLVSHQLRGPITNINGALELMAQDADALPPQSRRNMAILTQESGRLARLIGAILDVSRLEAGRLQLHLGPVALEPLVARTCATTLSGELQRDWHLTADPGLPPAWADELLIEEVLRNIVENAARYSPADQPIEVDASLRGDVLEVGVADHGPGVSAVEQASVFRSFHRIGDADSSIPGYGLGLYFAERLVHALHGEIGLSSPVHDGPPGPGSRFWFRLPVAGGGPDEDDEAPWLEADAPVADAPTGLGDERGAS